MNPYDDDDDEVVIDHNINSEKNKKIFKTYDPVK